MVDTIPYLCIIIIFSEIYANISMRLCKFINRNNFWKSKSLIVCNDCILIEFFIDSVDEKKRRSKVKIELDSTNCDIIAELVAQLQL